MVKTQHTRRKGEGGGKKRDKSIESSLKFTGVAAGLAKTRDKAHQHLEEACACMCARVSVCENKRVFNEMCKLSAYIRGSVSVCLRACVCVCLCVCTRVQIQMGRGECQGQGQTRETLFTRERWRGRWESEGDRKRREKKRERSKERCYSP